MNKDIRIISHFISLRPRQWCSLTVRKTDFSDVRDRVITFSSAGIRRCQRGGEKIPKNVSGYESRWLSAIFSKESRVVLQVKKWGPGEFNLSFLPWIPKMIASTVISLVVYITAVLGSPAVGNSGLIRLKILIPNFNLRDYSLVVWPSCHSAQPVSCAIWRSSSYLDSVAILRHPSLCPELSVWTQV